MADANPSPPVPTTNTVPARYTTPLLFGPLFNWALYGVLVVQIYVYSYNFPDDKLYLKLLVHLVFLLETAQTILSGLDVYHWFIDGFTDLAILERPWYTPIDLQIMFGLIALIVQMFFCSRIWILDKRLRWLCIAIAFLSATQAISAVLDGSEQLETGNIVKPSIYVWFCSGALADVLIAVAMASLLIRRRDNENQFSSYVLPRVVRLIIETNVLTTTVAVISLILFVVFPNDYYYITPATVFGKLYSNTLLVTLNNRIYFRDHPFPGVSHDSVYHTSGRNRPSERRLPIAKPLSVHARALRTKDTFRLDTLPSRIDPENGKATSLLRT